MRKLFMFGYATGASIGWFAIAMDELTGVPAFPIFNTIALLGLLATVIWVNRERTRRQ